METQLDRKNQKSDKQMREEMIIKLFYLTIGRETMIMISFQIFLCDSGENLCDP